MAEELYEDETQRDDEMGGGGVDQMEADEPAGDDEMLPGAHALHQMHDYFGAGKDMLNDLHSGQENTAVREKIQECLAKLEEEMTDLRDLFAQEYPDHEAPQGDEAEAEEGDDLTEESEDLRDTPDKVNETPGRPVPQEEVGAQGDRAENDERSRTRRSRKAPVRRRGLARSGVSRKSASDPLDRMLERKRARLLALETEDLD